MIVASAPTVSSERVSFEFDGVARVDGDPVGEGWVINIKNLDSQQNWEATTNGQGYYNRVGQAQPGDLIEWEPIPPAGEWLTQTVTTTLSHWDITEGGMELDLSYGSNPAALKTFDIGKVENVQMEPWDGLTNPGVKTINYGDQFQVKVYFKNDIDDPDETPDEAHVLHDTQWYYHETMVYLTVYQEDTSDGLHFLESKGWVTEGSKAKGGHHYVEDPPVIANINSYWAQAPPPLETGEMAGYGPNFQHEDGNGGVYYRIVAEVQMTISVYLGEDKDGLLLYRDNQHVFDTVTGWLYVNGIPDFDP